MIIKSLIWYDTVKRNVGPNAEVVCRANGIFGFSVTIYKVDDIYEASGPYCKVYKKYKNLNDLKK